LTTRWEGLAKQGFPMVFHGVVGEDKREDRSPSFFNAEEAVIVVGYVEKLLTSKIKVLKKYIWTKISHSSDKQCILSQCYTQHRCLPLKETFTPA
jgi:translation initiation factor 2 beta subunit (eIF-2beta)/eIF-5